MVDHVHKGPLIVGRGFERGLAFHGQEPAVFELAAFGIPTIFVPYPYAADDHQSRNVSPLGEIGAAIVVDNAEIDGETLEKMILSLLDDSARRRDMSAKLRAWSPGDADEKAAARISELVTSGKLRSAQLDYGSHHSKGGATNSVWVTRTG